MIDDATLGTVGDALDDRADGPGGGKRRGPLVAILKRTVPYLLAFGLVGWTIWRNRASIGAVFGRAPDGRFLGLAFLLGEVGLTSTFVRWYVLARSRAIPLTLGEAFRIGFLGHASELVVPGQLGGDVVKATALCRGRTRRAEVVASILFDRVAGVFGLFLLVSAVGAIQWPSAPLPVRRLVATVWVVTGCGGVAFAALFLPATSALVRRILGAGRLQEMVARLWEAAAAYRGRMPTVLLALGLAMASHLIYALAFYSVCCALFPVAPPLSRSLVIIPLILFTAIVPLPFGALGVGEGVSDELFRMIGYSIGTPAMLGARVVGLAVSCVSVLVYLANPRPIVNPEAPSEAAAASAAPVEGGA